MSLKGKYILIVEDNPLNRVVYQFTLGIGGAFIEFDRWGRDIVSKLKSSKKWDLIILDLMLYGGASGFNIFEEIRSIPDYAHIPIVAISASEPTVAIPKARQLGFSGFISKPIDEARICEQIEKIIEGERIWYDGTVHPGSS